MVARNATGKVEDRKMKTLKTAGFLMAAMLIISLPASAHGRFGGRVFVVPSYGAWNWYSPYFGPYGVYVPYWGYEGIGAGTAELKLKTNIKTAEVFINGAYAGKAANLKTMWLRPDAYTLEIRAPGYASFSERVYLVAGKTMKIDAELVSSPQS
jgi:hypothetical protein